VLLFVAHVMEKYPTRDGKLAFVTQLDNIIYDTRLNLTTPRGQPGPRCDIQGSGQIKVKIKDEAVTSPSGSRSTKRFWRSSKCGMRPCADTAVGSGIRLSSI
jgi:hypothetical protein